MIYSSTAAARTKTLSDPEDSGLICLNYNDVPSELIQYTVLPEDVFYKSGRRLLQKWKTSSANVEDVFWKRERRLLLHQIGIRFDLRHLSFLTLKG
jgi:hypothetical protein